MERIKEVVSGSQTEALTAGWAERSTLDNALRGGARRMLLAAIEEEVEAYVAQHRACVDPEDSRFSATLSSR
ncbi:MAG: hypothetical protein NTW86_10045 [Candidatus Sumerlaeota bacterium]|nr:hypothetical protein [Candidatus Sumerlaeota bacterium]